MKLSIVIVQHVLYIFIALKVADVGIKFADVSIFSMTSSKSDKN